MFRKTVCPRLTKRVVISRISQLRITPQLISVQQQTILYQSTALCALKYSFSTEDTPTRQRISISEHTVTKLIEMAKTAQELHGIINSYKDKLNFIHRTALLQRVTQRPFDKDEELVSRIIHQIKRHWNSDFLVFSQLNSRAVANTICYMSRKAKFHDLDEEFAQIDFHQLSIHLTNPKQFVMMINGILKLQLLEKVMEKKIHFMFQEFIAQKVDQKFTPSLLVSMWFNIIKYQKSSQTINDLFANLLKNKHFKSNLIDYMQILYCYVKSQGKRSVDLIYPVMTHPKEVQNPKGYLGAHELSVLYEQLGNLKKIKDVYFSDEFNLLLQDCFRRILTEKDIPLRNVANVFVNLTSWENPTSKILDSVYHKYYTVLRNQISLIQSVQQNKKFRPNVDPLSFVTLFELLLDHYQTQNTYLKEMTEISLNYLQKIMEKKIIAEYNEKTFVRLLSAIQMAKKKLSEKSPQDSLYLDKSLKDKFTQQISKRYFNEVASLRKLIGFAYVMEIREKQVCKALQKMMKTIPAQNQLYETYQKTLKQECILDKNCSNCHNCLS